METMLVYTDSTKQPVAHPPDYEPAISRTELVRIKLWSYLQILRNPEQAIRLPKPLSNLEKAQVTRIPNPMNRPLTTQILSRALL